MFSRDQIKRRPLLYLGGGLALLQVGLSSPDINAQMEAREQMQAVRQSERQEQSRMILAAKARQERSDIALQRYQAGCLRMINRDNDNNPIAIKEGDMPLDYYNDVPLSPGTVVCDSYGTTGVVGSDYRVADVAVLLDLNQIPDPVNQADGGMN